MPPIAIRPLGLEDVQIAVEWAAREGWNPGLGDAAAFHATDPEGFLGGFADGDLVATVSAVRYPEGFGFLGFYIVRPDRRGQGLGLAMWRAAMARLADVTVGLDGVVAQQTNYRKSGFALAWNNVRYEGDRLARRAGDPAIVPARQIPVGDLSRFDRRYFPSRRDLFLDAWLATPGHVALALQERGQLAGYGVLRPCRAGFKVGPLFAVDADVASRLLAALAAHTPAGARIQLDLPAVNADAVAMASAQGMSPVFETARMYRGPAPAIDRAGVFGVTTFELG